MNRREASKSLIVAALGMALGAPSASAQPQPVRVALLGDLGEIWADREFIFAGQQALLVRVPAPGQPSSRVLQVGSIYLTAYSRTCTHAGCTVQLPDQRQMVECGCHGSRFSAAGLVLEGPAPNDLPAIRLEVRQNEIWAVAWLDG